MNNKNNHNQLIKEKALDEIAEVWARLILAQIKNEPKIPRKYRGNSWVKLG